jgi:hypothetical protein
MQLMAGLPVASRAVASRNPERRMSSRPAALVSCLLLGAVGCGADADGVSQGSGALEPRLSQAADGSDDGASARDGADGAASSSADAPDAPGATEDRGTPLVLPSRGPITEPPDPEPFPTTELDTQRPVNSTEPVDVIIPPGECRFEYLGQAVRCENAGAHVVVTDASDLFSCMRQCLERDDCTAVTDYLYLGEPAAGCQLHLSTCDDPTLVDGDEEDGGHDFRRVCDDD